MKIVFLSNFLNHHQTPVSEELWALTGGDYYFVETEAMPRERIELGYVPVKPPYVVRLAEDREGVLRLVREADVVIAGSAPEWLVRLRINTGKLLFRYAERPLRHGREMLKFIPRWVRWHWRNPGKKPIYLLCASGYTAGDYALFGLFRGKAYQWGYFPEWVEQDVSGLLSKKQPGEILWVGRFLELKHPELALEAAGRLKRAGYDFRLNFIGTGEQEGLLKELAAEWDLQGRVVFSGARSPAQVREAMDRAAIFLFTSDRREGWGAVVNEAMNSGCAVIASREAGAAPFLLRHGENGLIFSTGDAEELERLLRQLLEDVPLQQRLGAGACRTIGQLWNPNVAARRLIRLSEALLEGVEAQDLFSSGPCSRAEPLEEGWFSCSSNDG